MAFRATLAGVVTQQDHAHRHYDEPGDDQENRPGRQLVAGRIGAAQIQFAPFEQLRHGFDPLHHAEAVIALAECREHVFELDALADRIGQHTLQPAARDETDLATVFDQQDAQPVVVAGLPHAPRGEEVDGEVEDVAACDVISSTATTATWATARSRSAAHKRSICATASSESIPSGFET